MNTRYLIIYLYLLFIQFGIKLHAQVRYESEIFSTYDIKSDIQYGRAIKANGSAMDLFLDFYSPTGDTASNRPLVIFIHGGGFKDGDKVTNFGTRVCSSLAKRGYIVASINYRLGTDNTIKGDFEAMIRAVQDAKAAVRFFRKNSNLYGVDTSQIFATGSSAGSITALHLAYLNENEIPSYVDLRSVGIGGTLEGTSGNAGYSSKINGVISNWGALTDFQWMKTGDPPVFCVHGVNDVTVPYDSSFSDGPFKYGSVIIYHHALNFGITTGIRLFENTGHTLDNNAAKQDSAISDFCQWLFSILKTNNPSDLKDQGKLITPSNSILNQNFPNPFNPVTNIKYSLSSACNVELGVFDILGRNVSILKNQFEFPGLYNAQWNGKDGQGRNVPSGVYFVKLNTETSYSLIKMVLMR